MKYVKDIDSGAFQVAVVQRSHEVPVVVDFWAAWCGPCRVLGPTLERLAEEHAGAFELVKVDVDANPDLAQRFGVQGIPTVVGFKDGVAAHRFTGALPEQAVRQWLQQLLPTEPDRLVDQARDAILDGQTEEAERLFRAALELEPRHQEAGTALGALLIADGRPEEALEVLDGVSPTGEVQRLQAAARLASKGGDFSDLEERLSADPDDEHARLRIARALAAHAEFEPALDHLLAVIRLRGDLREEARQAMLDIFEVLGNDHPLTNTYRRQLASELF